jgi:hypothetical protein
VPRNRDNNRQMAQKVAVHSFTISHNACDLNSLIE